MKFLKPKRVLLLCLILFVVYLAAGAAAPFWTYKQVGEAAMESFDLQEVTEPRTKGDRAMLLESNLSAWEERIRLLNRAEEQIILSTFDMREGESTQDIASVLLKKADEGVKVRIVVDGVSGAVRMDHSVLFRTLAAQPNIEIKLYNRLNIFLPWKTQGRMHDKYIIVDDQAYILGGRNTFDYFLGDYTTKNISYDREVLVYNTQYGSSKSHESSIHQAADYFDAIWSMKECTYFHNDETMAGRKKYVKQADALRQRYAELTESRPDLFTETDYEEMTVPTDGIVLLSNPTGIYGKEPVLFYQLSRLMEQAEKEVIIHTPYVVCNDYMTGVLKELNESVPEMRILLNSVENGDNFFASSDYLIHKKDLIETGVTFYEYDGGISYHGKSIAIDGKYAVIGSYNLDLRSTYMDTELMLVVKSEELTGRLLENMDAIQKDARKVTGEKTYETPSHITVEKVPWWKRAAWSIVGRLMQPFRFLI